MDSFSIKKLFAQKPVALAPMDGYTNIPLRLITKETGADLLFTEFVNSDAIIHYSKKSLQKIRILEKERPVAIQIFGKSPDKMAEAAKIIEEFHPDIIDLNFGCPAPKVSGHGSGSALLRDLPLVSKICEAVVRSVSIPVSAKTRLGWDERSVNIFQTAKIFEESGISFITLHPRTRSQKFSGRSDWSYIQELKTRISVPLFGNGDICSAEDAVRMFKETGCDGVMVGRQAVKNPWIFRDIKELLEKGVYCHLSDIEERKRLCLKHLNLSVEYVGERKGILEMRKYYQNYFKGIEDIKFFRQKLLRTEDIEEIRALINSFSSEKDQFMSNQKDP